MTRARLTNLIALLALTAAVWLVNTLAGYGQCARMRDPRNAFRLTYTPVKNFACLTPTAPANATVLRIEFEFPISNFQVDWGDGSPVQSYTGPLSQVSRQYADTGIYTYRVIQQGCSQVISGLFINHYNTRSPGIGFIFPPAGVDNRRCLPAVLSVTNSSPGMTPFTEYIINWGDNSKLDTVDFRSFNQAIPHTFLSNSRLCRTRMTVVYRNICGNPTGSVPLSQSAGDYFWLDKDSALTSPVNITICQPEEIVVNDASKLHCLDTSGRRIAWQRLSGFAAPLPPAGDGVFRTYNVALNKRLTLPASTLSPVPADSVYKLRMFLRNQCGTDTTEITIRYARPRAPIMRVLAQDVCPGQPVSLANETFNPYPAGVMTYEWDFGDGTPPVTSDAPVVEHTYEQGGTYTVRLSTIVRSSLSSNVCRRTTQATVTVRRAVSPRVDLIPDRLCQQGVIVIKNRSINTAGAIWGGWQLGKPTLSGGSDFLPDPLALTDTSMVALRGINTADSTARLAIKRPGRYIISLRAQAPGCPQVVSRDTIDVYPNPTLRWRASGRTICVGRPLTIRDSSSVLYTDTNGLPSDFRSVRWRLDFGDSTIVKSQTPVLSNFDQVVASGRLTQHTYARPGRFPVVLTVWSGPDQCPRLDTLWVTVNANPTPVLRARRATCEPSLVTVELTNPPPADGYLYDVFRGLVRVGTHQAAGPGPYQIRLPYVPPGDSTTYTLRARILTISGTDTCQGLSQSIVMGVRASPVAAFDVSPSTNGCHPLTNVSFVNTSLNMAYDTTHRFLWQFGRGLTSTLETPAPVTFVNTGSVMRRDTVRFSISRGDGCVFRAEREILTFPGPQATIIAPDSICSGVPVTLLSTGQLIAQYRWSFADYDQSATSQQSPTKTFVNHTGQAQTYIVTLEATTANGCRQLVTHPIKVFPQPEAEIQLTPTLTPGCSPMRVQIAATHAASVLSYQWIIGGGDTITRHSPAAFEHIFSNEGVAPLSVPITMKAISGGACHTTRQTTLSVPSRVATTITGAPAAVCSPARVQLGHQSSAGATELLWQSGGQSYADVNQLSVDLVNSSPLRDTTLTVRLIARSRLSPQCRDTATARIRVMAKPEVAGINLSSLRTCSPYRDSLRVVSQGVRRFEWDFGDGSMALDSTGRQSHTWENLQPTADRQYRIRVIGSNAEGCRDTAHRSISVRPMIRAGMIILDSSGCTPHAGRYSSAASINANSFSWQFGTQAQSQQANPTLSLENLSDTVLIVPVRLIARKVEVSGCADTAYGQVKVYPRPRASFSLSQTIGCGPLPIRLSNESERAWQAEWRVSSGGATDTLSALPGQTRDTVLTNPSPVSKAVRIELIARSVQACQASQTQHVTVYGDLTARFSADTAGCHPHRVRIVNESANYGGSFHWQLGDGNVSTIREPEHVYTYTRSRDTTYTLRLTSISAVGGCRRSDSVRIRVYGRPRAQMQLSTPRLQLPANTLTITNLTTHRPDWRYHFDFGDGRMDTTRARTLVHRYLFDNEDFVDTNFRVRLIAFSDFGCRDTVQTPLVIQPMAPIPDFEVSERSGCSPLTVAFYNRSTYGREYLWEFGDAGISDLKNPVHTYVQEGYYRVRLTAKGFGGTRTVVRDSIIHVKGFPRAFFYTLKPEVVLPEDPAVFVLERTCLECTYEWDFGDGTTSREMKPLHYYRAKGTYTVTLTVTDPNGCQSTFTRPDAVKVVDDLLLRIPNVFRPTLTGSSGGFTDVNQGDNTIFYPFTQGARRIRLQIYNRWGQLLYESQTLNKGWDGYLSNGLMAPADTYVYLMEVEFVSGEVRKTIGDVTLLR